MNDDGKVVLGVWVQEMTGRTEVDAQGKRMDEWARSMTAEVRKKPS